MLSWADFMNAKSQNKIIAFTKVSLPYGWMGNMAPYTVSYNNKVWPTSEALFQALRYKHAGIQKEILQQSSPMAAKMKSKSYADKRVVEPQSQQDLENMEMVLRLKLDQHPELKTELKNTGNKTIIEDSSNRASGSGLFWGAAFQNGQWTGQNILGKLWMKLRTEL